MTSPSPKCSGRTVLTQPTLSALAGGSLQQMPAESYGLTLFLVLLIEQSIVQVKHSFFKRCFPVVTSQDAPLPTG